MKAVFGDCRIAACLTFVVLATFAHGIRAQATDFEGQIVFARVIELRAGVSGILAVADVAPGSVVEKGRELATLSVSFYAGRLESAEQALAVARLELDEARRAFERDEVLYEEGSLAQVDLDRAALSLSRARASASAALTALDASRSQATLSRMLAPFDAVVLDVPGMDGAYVNATVEAPLVMTLAERGALAARVGVTAAARKNLILGGEARVTVQGEERSGTVRAIRYSVEGGAWMVDVGFDSADVDVVAGLPARVEFP